MPPDPPDYMTSTGTDPDGPHDAGHLLPEDEWARVQEDARRNATDPGQVDYREPEDLAGDPTPDGPQ